MATRSLNKVMLIGNLTRDPELRYTPQGTAVCTLGMATNRTWVTDGGDKKEETEFHRIVAWNKLAELCSQLLYRGRRVYVEGRLQTRQWTGQDGAARQATEVVIEDMIVLDARRQSEEPALETTQVPVVTTEAGETEAGVLPAGQPADDQAAGVVASTGKVKKADKDKTEAVVDDIPF